MEFKNRTSQPFRKISVPGEVETLMRRTNQALFIKKVLMII